MRSRVLYEGDCIYGSGDCIYGSGERAGLSALLVLYDRSKTIHAMLLAIGLSEALAPVQPLAQQRANSGSP